MSGPMANFMIGAAPGGVGKGFGHSHMVCNWGLFPHRCDEVEETDTKAVARTARTNWTSKASVQDCVQSFVTLRTFKAYIVEL